MSGPETRASLLEKLNSPSREEGWEEFASLYSPLIYRVAIAKGLQHADAEDLTQEVLANVQRSLGSYDPSRGSFRGWLYTITRNLVINFLTRNDEPAGSGDSKVAGMLGQYPQRKSETASLFQLEFRRARFRQAASIVQSDVHPMTWEAFWMTAVELQSVESVAKHQGKSCGAIRVARCRVLARIRATVKELNGGFDPIDYAPEEENDRL